MKIKYFIAGVLITVFASCKKDNNYPLPNRCGYPGIEAKKISGYNVLFSGTDNQLKSGHINSSLDWNGKKIWFISGGVLNKNNTDISLSNCILLQNNQQIEVKYNSLLPQPASFIPEPDALHFYSLNQGIIIADVLEIIVSKYEITGTGLFDFKIVETKIYKINLNNWSIISETIVVANNEILFGAALLKHNGYTYIYATKNAGFLDKHAFIARIPNGSLLQPWEYFDGYGWQASLGMIKPFITGVSDYFSIFKSGDRFYIAAHGAVFGQEIKLFDAHAPDDGWRYLYVLYCRSGVTDNLSAVNATIHQSTADELICSFNYVSKDLTGAEKQAPEFISIRNWKQGP